MAKVQLEWDILIFLQPVGSNNIFIFHTNMHNKWAKNEKFEKIIKNNEFLQVKRFLLSFADFYFVLIKTSDSGGK